MKELVDHASDELGVALAELRELARGVYPPSLRERGLAGSLTALAERSALPIQLEIDLPHRPPPQVELAAYFICAEAVTNAAKHARASTLLMGVKGTDAELALHVTDNGIGGASAGADGGLLGLADRAAALGGSLTVTSPEGRGTTVAATLPFSADPTEDMP
jgi:signal transduction histidine kinase